MPQCEHIYEELPDGSKICFECDQRMTPINPKNDQELLEMLEMVMSKARFEDPLVAAIGDVWIDKIEPLRQFWDTDIRYHVKRRRHPS